MTTRVKNLLTINRTAPAFSGETGQISHIGGASTKSGQRVDEVSALRVAAIWIATTTIADQSASLKQRIVEAEGETRQPLKPENLRALWGRPNSDQTRYSLDVAETLSMALWGFSATMLGWVNSGALDVRWPIDPSGVQLTRTEKGGLKLTSPGQGELFNEPNERPQFSFIPLYQLPGQLMPVSPVRMAAEIAGLSLAYEEASSRLMATGMNPAAIVTVDQELQLEQSREYSETLSAAYGGSKNAGKWIVIGGKGIKLEKPTMTMADAEFVSQNKVVFDTLMAMWKVPPTVAGMADKPSTWGSGIAEFTRGMWYFAVRPFAERREAAHQDIARWVDPDLQVKYDFDSLLSASPKERTEIQRTKLMSGMTSQERILAQEDEPPFGVGETVFSQLAMAAEEDRELARLRSRAETYGALIRAGVKPESAAKQAGFDPAELVHTGTPPVTVQGD